MTTQLQSPPANPRYTSIAKPLRSCWLLGLLLASGIVGGGFSLYRAVSPAQNANG